MRPLSQANCSADQLLVAEGNVKECPRLGGSIATATMQQATIVHHQVS